MHHIRILMITAICAVALACATSPTGRRQLILLPEDQMAALGVQAFDQIKTEEPVSKDPAANRYVQCISNAILSATGLSEGQAWEVVVFDSDQVNAFALPGAKIGVYTGMIRFAETPDQLAAVVGHEIGHVIAGREQKIRFVVIDRKVTQGTKGEVGWQWCQRIWSTIATCRQRGISVYRFLLDAIAAHLHNRTTPSLISA